jgi:apolipoprotein N-acyltransferase
MAEARRGAWLWLAAYALATFLSFPHPLGQRVLDLGWLVAWAAPACLVLGLEGQAPRRAALLGFAAGLVAHWAVLHWIYVVTVRYGHAHPVVGVVAPLGLAAYIAAHTALFAAGAAWLARGGPWLASPLALAALWTACDHLRAFSLSGFPWATLGYAQHSNATLMALAPFTGVYGLCFVTALGGTAAAAALRERRAGRFPSAPLRASFAALVALIAAGAALRSTVPADPPETLRVAVLQGNIDQGVKWSQDWYETTLSIYAGLTRRAVERGARVVVWPETAVPAAIGGAGDLAARLSALARETGALLVVGAVGLERSAAGPPRIFDSAFVVDGAGALRERYDKSHLVPFGEYVPFQELLGRFFHAVARGMAESRVTAGPGPRALALDPPGGDGVVSAGVPICYELLFPDLVRRFVAGGAEILVAITNDAWYGRTGAPYQFLAITALRAAENRVWTVRAANTGVSAIIDATGRVRARTRIFERDLLVADVPLRPPPAGGSFYTRHGDLFAWACWLAAAACSVAAWRRRAGA